MAKKFTTYSPNDPNLIEKLSEKGVSISASPLDEKMPSLFGVLLSWFLMLLLIAVWIFYGQNARWQRWSHGIW